MKRVVLLIACSCWLVACGGGGRSSNPVPFAPPPAAADRELRPLAVAPGERTVMVWYQPVPTPARVGTHVVDGWLPSVYYGKTFHGDDQMLQIGGWNDSYRTYIQFELTGLPPVVNDATLMLWAVPRGDASTTVNFDAWSPQTAWVTTSNDYTRVMSTSMTWDTQPAGFTLIGGNAARAVNGFWPIPITGTYNDWQTAPDTKNHGLALMSWTQNNNFDVWRSSRSGEDGHRPMLQLTFQTSAPDFKLPLPRNYKWLVTTELGGWDCKGNIYDKYHDGINYFSVDFAFSNIPPPGAAPYGNPNDIGVKIPISPAADGIVGKVNATNKYDDNGYYVVIAHDDSGDFKRGFSTRYLHLKHPPLVTVGQRVYRDSTILGYMGNTGLSHGPHLHFGMRYDNDGSPAQTRLATAVVSGWLMKSFQSECSNGTWNRYYLSS